MKVVISHSWSRNMGDAAILRAIVDIVRDIDPDCTVHALVSHPEFSRPRSRGLKAELEGWIWPVPKGERASIGELFTYPFVFVNNFVSAALHRLGMGGAFIFNRAQSSALTRFFESDIVISPGGDFIGPYYFFMTSFGEFLLAKALGKKLVICAQTIGPFRGLLNGFISARVLNLADLIIVRDKVTADSLARLGVRDVRLTTDIVFTLPRLRRGRESGKVVICPKRLRKGNEAYARRMAGLTRRIRKELDMKVVFLPTDLYDRAFQARIAGMAGGDVELITELHPPDKIAGLLSDTEFIVSSRMHAIILGTLSSTPFFAIGDSHKFDAILGELSLGCVISHDEFDEDGANRIIGAIRRRREIREGIHSRFGALQKKSFENASILKEKFTEWGLGRGDHHGGKGEHRDTEGTLPEDSREGGG